MCNQYIFSSVAQCPKESQPEHPEVELASVVRNQPSHVSKHARYDEDGGVCKFIKRAVCAQKCVGEFHEAKRSRPGRKE